MRQETNIFSIKEKNIKDILINTFANVEDFATNEGGLVPSSYLLEILDSSISEYFLNKDGFNHSYHVFHGCMRFFVREKMRFFKMNNIDVVSVFLWTSVFHDIGKFFDLGVYSVDSAKLCEYIKELEPYARFVTDCIKYYEFNFPKIAELMENNDLGYLFVMFFKMAHGRMT